MKKTPILKDLKSLIEKNYKIIVCLFFVAFLLVGVSIYKDYGISWDEGMSRSYGEATFRYIKYENRGLFNHSDKYHGPIFELFLAFIERTFDFPDERSVYLMRHLITFLLFYISVIFFYLLCKKRFESWKIGLLGCLLLILSPRIFAHSFYNPKDIPFLALFIISIYTMIRYLDKRTLKNALFHALACALLIDIRVIGAMVPLFTILIIAGDLLVSKKEEEKGKKDKKALKPIIPVVGNILMYAVLTSFFTILFWPTLWRNPIHHFKMALIEMSYYPWDGSVLYLGKELGASEIPWHYIPVWILVSTPVLYSAFFLGGSFILIKLLIKKPKEFYITRRDDLVYMTWFFFPVIAIIALRPIIYDEWRQMLFIYPAFLMIALVGVTTLYKYIEAKFKGRNYRIVNSVFIGIIAISLLGTGGFMIANHPFQNVYFNKLAGMNMEAAKANFDMDYWGLSYRQALEYILKNDPDSVITIYAENDPGEGNAEILTLEDKERLVFVEKEEDAEYFISNYRWHAEEYPYENEFFSIKVGGAKIMVVYRINEGMEPAAAEAKENLTEDAAKIKEKSITKDNTSKTVL